VAVNTNDDIMTLEEVAHYLKLKPQTVYHGMSKVASA
jgi:predicted DNA-binding transcriptional regulator AlpA